MANVQGPFGFQQVGTASGPPNFARAGSPNPYKIKAGYTTAIYFGDAVRLAVSGETTAGTTQGYVVPWVVGDGATTGRILSGIFVGCEYYSTSQQKTVWSRFYPGSDAANDVSAYVVDDPNSQWVVQANPGPINITAIGQVIDIVASPVGNTTTGFSGMSVAAPSNTPSTFPFKVVNLATTPPGVNGTDITTAYNNVIVAFNNQQYKALLGQ